MNKLTSHIFAVAFIALIFQTSCSEDKSKTNESAEIKTISKIKDTVTSLGDDLKPGTYVFKTLKGNYFLFDVSNEQDSIDHDSSSNKNVNSIEVNDNPMCEGPDFDASYRAKVKYTPSRKEIKEENASTLLAFFKKNHDLMCDDRANLPDDRRLNQEDKNVRVKVYLYTFKRQGDEDYHLVFGTTPNINTAKFFNCEISGLSPSGTYGRSKLVDARNTFEENFGIQKKCARSYYTNDFRSAPRPVILEGSLFFDGEHCTHYEDNGPQNWKELEVTIAWEIHPITSIEFLE